VFDPLFKMSNLNNQYHTVSVGYNSFYIDQRYRNLKPIGDGSYGFVASATDTVTGNKVAIKKVKDTFLDVVDAKRILREIKLLNHFDKHENIITIYDLMSNPPNKEHFDDIYIVTNLMESDLERIIRSKQVLTDQHLQYFLFQILRGMKYVHSANVLHRDLKPSNLLVNANCDLALCDFGLARGFDAGVDMLTEYVVTRWYRPPELLLECTLYGKPVDVWSVGCIFAEVIVHEPFFRGDNPQHQLQVIVSKLGKYLSFWCIIYEFSILDNNLLLTPVTSTANATTAAVAAATTAGLHAARTYLPAYLTRNAHEGPTAVHRQRGGHEGDLPHRGAQTPSLRLLVPR
jgi:serine/threonine protein kinase